MGALKRRSGFVTRGVLATVRVQTALNAGLWMARGDLEASIRCLLYLLTSMRRALPGGRDGEGLASM